MADIKVVLDRRKKYSDGKYPIRINVNIKGKGRIRLLANMSIEDKHWSNGQVIGLQSRNIKNGMLRLRVGKIDDELLRLEMSGQLSSMSISQIQKRLSNVVNNLSLDTDEMLFTDYFRKIIEKKRNARTKESYSYTLDTIMSYDDSESLPFSDVTVTWLEDFETHLLDKNISINTVSIHMRNIRSVFNSAIDNDVIQLNTYPFRRFKIKSEKTLKRSLTVGDLRILRDYPCEPHQEQYRDIFMLIFYLIGINTIDLLNLKEINNGRIEYRRAKTGRLYSLAVPPEAMQIIDKYRGKNYLLDVMDRYSYYKDFTARLNKNLKQIGELKYVENSAKDPIHRKKNKKERVPLFPQISTYWARHTWATIAASLDIPKETIAAALGHGGNTVTDIYINFDQKKIDEANRKVLDFLNEGDSL